MFFVYSEWRKRAKGRVRAAEKEKEAEERQAMLELTFLLCELVSSVLRSRIKTGYWTGFFRTDSQTGRQNKVKKQGTGPVTGFQTGQGRFFTTCLGKKPVTVPVFCF